jgi:hypothetical protein
MLLNLMAPNELKEAIEFLRKKLTESITSKGFSDKRTVEISQRLDLYIVRFNQIKGSK